MAHLLDDVVGGVAAAAVLDAHHDLMHALGGQEALPDALPVAVELLHAQRQQPAAHQ